MKKHILFFLLLAGMIWIAPGAPCIFSQTEYHGADSVFEKEGIAILWAILKGKDESSSWVYTKIINFGGNSFQFYSVEAVDPFSKQKEWLLKGMKLEKENLVKSVRTSFRDKTSRRILFYRNEETLEEQIPDMTVFYMGVPDTSPEVLSEKELGAYFERALEQLKK